MRDLHSFIIIIFTFLIVDLNSLVINNGKFPEYFDSTYLLKTFDASLLISSTAYL